MGKKKRKRNAWFVLNKNVLLFLLTVFTKFYIYKNSDGSSRSFLKLKST